MHRLVSCALLLVLAAPPAFAQSVKSKSQPASAAAARDAAGKLNLDNGVASVIACTGGNYDSTHNLGFVAAGTRIKVTFQSGESIDPIATVAILQMGANVPGDARAAIAFDDDSGGGRDPRIEVTAGYNGNVVLSVGSYDGSFGCFAAKVEIS
jgi:hypothetical protein